MGGEKVNSQKIAMTVHYCKHYNSVNPTILGDRFYLEITTN